MRQQMEKTLAGLNEKLGALEDQVSGTFQTVKESVNTVRDTFDVKLQVRRRPWTLLTAAAALGFLGGFRSNSNGSGHRAQDGVNLSVPPAPIAIVEPPCSGTNGGMNGEKAARLIAAAPPGWLVHWGSTFQPEITALRGVAAGVLLELLREVITKPAPRPKAQQAADPKNGSNGGPATQAIPDRIPAKRRIPSSRLHPLEDLSDGKIVRRPR
jgi:hypothetical protein